GADGRRPGFGGGAGGERHHRQRRGAGRTHLPGVVDAGQERAARPREGGGGVGERDNGDHPAASAPLGSGASTVTVTRSLPSRWYLSSRPAAARAFVSIRLLTEREMRTRPALVARPPLRTPSSSAISSSAARACSFCCLPRSSVALPSRYRRMSSSTSSTWLSGGAGSASSGSGRRLRNRQGHWSGRSQGRPESTTSSPTAAS